MIQSLSSFYDYVKGKALSYVDSTAFNFFREKAQSWARMVVALNDLQVPASMQAEKNALLSTAKTIKTTVEKILGVLPELKNSGLGLLPLIPVAIVASALALMTKWITEYGVFVGKVQEQKRLEQYGLPPAQASQIVNQNYGDKPFLGIDLKSWIVPAVLVGGAAWYFMGRRR